MDKKIFEDGFVFKPYQSVGSLSFNENEENIKSKLGDIKQEFDNYGDSGKTVIFNVLDGIYVYFDNKNNFYGIHFFDSIKFTLNGKLYDINFDNFTEKDLNDISDDFKMSSGGDCTCYTSEKLGIDFDFNDENNVLSSVLFMSKEYYKNEI